MKGKKSVLLTAFLAVAMCVTIIVGATFALFGAKDTRQVTVTTGSVKISAEFSELTLFSLTDGVERQCANDTNFTSGGTAKLEAGTLTLTSILPGDRATFRLKITNTGNSSAKWKVAIGLPEGIDTTEFICTVTDDAKNDCSEWSDNALATKGEVTLTVTVQLHKDAQQPILEDGSVGDYFTGSVAVTFTVYAGQSNASDDQLDEVFELTQP